MIGKETIKQFIGRSSVLLAAIAVSCGITYLITSKMNDSQISDLKEQIGILEKKEHKARVTQRVSEQMEEIASQQTLVSNKERDRAEEQKKIADIERGKAEMEKGLALEAQQRALVSAAEAEESRQKAEHAQKQAEKQSLIAIENQKIAEDARMHADTLLYYSLANSLAQSSIAQPGGELCDLLAYSSWYFSEKYHSAVANLGNVFYALLMSSDSYNSCDLHLKGQIRRLFHLGANVIGVTDYGEVFYYDEKELESLNIDKCDFRDFITEGKSDNIVLSVDGRIYHMDLTNLYEAKTIDDVIVKEKVRLPKDFWYRLISLNDDRTIVAMGERTVAWIDSKTFEIIATKTFDTDLKTIGVQDGYLHIFGFNGHFVSDMPGAVAPLDLTNVDGVVTAYMYDDLREYHILGTNMGRIYVIDKNGQIVSTLVGHSGSITDLHTWGIYLGSISNDKSMMIWNMADLSTMIAPVTIKLSQRPLCFDVNKTREMVYIGTGGSLTTLCSSAQRNAQATKEKLTREFTDDEWNYYVGKEIKRIKFMK